MKFPTKVIKNGKVFSLMNFIEEDAPFIVFAPANIQSLSNDDRFMVSFGD